MSIAILEDYESFVKSKRRIEVATGHTPGELNANLFDFQMAIVAWAVRRGWTTALDALKDCGCMLLAARVLEMRQAGLTVADKWVDVGGKRFKAYKIVEAA